MTFFVPGYARVKSGAYSVVATEQCAPVVAELVRDRTLFEHAAADSSARELRGRGPAYAILLPGACGRVVVRHARRGGWVAGLTDDLFFSRLRPVRELVASLRLRLADVPTPELMAYVVYPAGPFFRYDVATREVEHGADLAEWLGRTEDAGTRTALIEGTAVLLQRLSEAGAHHADLNAKNILLVPRAAGFEGVVIDVDRVRFHASRSPMVAAANVERLQRSLRKHQRLGLRVSEAEIGHIARRADELQRERRAAEQAIA